MAERRLSDLLMSESLLPAQPQPIDAVTLAQLGGDPWSGVQRRVGEDTSLSPANMAMGIIGGPALGRTLGQIGIRAYHGSPHKFDKFDMSKIGTGEGAQAYGHGLYFAENEGTARSYRDALRGGPQWTVDGSIPGPNQQSAIHSLAWASPTSPADGFKVTREILERAKVRHLQKLGVPPNAKEYLQDFDGLLGKTIGVERPTGHMYEVNIRAKPEQFLDWDRPLSQQPEVYGNIERAASKLYGQLPWDQSKPMVPVGSTRGFEAYRDISNEHSPRPGFTVNNPSAQASTAALREAGIPGIKYRDQFSRRDLDLQNVIDMNIDPARVAQAKAELASRPPPTSNYVLFDDSIIDILKRYGIATGVGTGLMSMSEAKAQTKDK